MDSDGLPIIGPGIDYEQVSPIQQKRMLAFINHFTTHTVQFLNNFSCVCEKKLQDINVKVQRLEDNLIMLENKINSIPGLENVIVKEKESSDERKLNTEKKEIIDDSNLSKQTKFDNSEENENPPPENLHLYAKYLKMLKVGIHKEAIKQKMRSDGLDDSLLETLTMEQCYKEPDPETSSNSSISEFSDEE